MRPILTLAFVLLLSSFLFSQGQTKAFALEGTVTAYGGAVVPGITVTATNAKGKRVSTSTGPDGQYKLDLAEGVYTLEFELKGEKYKRSIVEGVIVPLVNLQTIDVEMEVGECSDCYGEMLGKERWDYYGVLTGTIYDGRGAVIRNATVRVKGQDGVERISKSNREGVYQTRIMVGLNQIRFEAKGFETKVLDNYQVVRSYKGKMFLDVSMNFEVPVVNKIQLP